MSPEFESEFCSKHFIYEEKVKNIESQIVLLHSDMKHVKWLLAIVIAVLLGVNV